MRRLYALIVACTALYSANSYADTVVWKGEVNSNGKPTEAIELKLDEKYQIKVSGTINLGKWWKAGEPLSEDACYDVNPKTTPEKIDSIKNSINISVCDGKYHPDHIYISAPFQAKQNLVHFWVSDTDYTDNNGAFQVEIINLGK